MIRHRICTLLLLLLPLSLAARTYVVSVGICNYQYIRGLRQTENDARSIASLYRSRQCDVTTLLGAQATHEGIISALRTVSAKAEKDDVVVFFFSGHGGKGGLCAYDTQGASTFITYTEIAKELKNCKADNKQLYIDACYSGGLRLDGSRSTPTAQSTFSNTEGVMLFLSSRSGETSQENFYGPNGKFTKYLLRGLKGGADTNRNRIVEAKELFTFVSAKVVEASKGLLHPVMWGRFNDGMHLMNWNPKSKAKQR